MSDTWEAIVSAYWIVGTQMSWLAIIGLFIWVVGWGVRFKFWQTMEGLILWAFSAELMLLVLNNIIGGLGASTREWWQPPPNDFGFWYFTRFGLNAIILTTIILMLRILWKHWRNGTSVNITIPRRESRLKTGPTPTHPPVDTTAP